MSASPSTSRPATGTSAASASAWPTGRSCAGSVGDPGTEHGSGREPVRPLSRAACGPATREVRKRAGLRSSARLHDLPGRNGPTRPARSPNRTARPPAGRGPAARDASATAKKVAPTHFSRPAPRTPATERCNDAILRVRRIAERPKEAREPRFCAAVPDLRHPYARAAARTARGMRTPRSTRPRRRTAPRMRYCSRAWSAPGATSPPMPVASTPAALGMRATRFDKFGCTAPIKNDRSRAVQAMLV